MVGASQTISNIEPNKSDRIPSSSTDAIALVGLADTKALEAGVVAVDTAARLLGSAAVREEAPIERLRLDLDTVRQYMLFSASLSTPVGRQPGVLTTRGRWRHPVLNGNSGRQKSALVVEHPWEALEGKRMKVRSSISARCGDCRITRRHGVVQVRCSTSPRHNQRQG
jgi:large subunit ribosomal protein L36